MTNVPKRNLSYGEILERQRLADKQKKQQAGTRDVPAYFEAKDPKAGPVAVYQADQLPGPAVPTNLPHPHKCSKCSYVAVSRHDLNLHWIDEH